MPIRDEVDRARLRAVVRAGLEPGREMRDLSAGAFWAAGDGTLAGAGGAGGAAASAAAVGVVVLDADGGLATAAAR